MRSGRWSYETVEDLAELKLTELEPTNPQPLWRFGMTRGTGEGKVQDGSCPICPADCTQNPRSSTFPSDAAPDRSFNSSLMLLSRPRSTLRLPSSYSV